jgi:hypothetical protein
VLSKSSIEALFYGFAPGHWNNSRRAGAAGTAEPLINSNKSILERHTLAPFPARGPKGMEMNVFKNMEVVLLFSFGVVCAAAYLRDVPPAAPARTPSAAEARGTPSAAMPVVVISAKRLSAAEKQAIASLEARADRVAN